MSTRCRKRPGGAVDSRPARKRSRLLPSSAGGTSQTEPIELEESGAPAFEPAGGEFIDLTGESSEPEVITVSDDESSLDREQSQQQPHLPRASENSVEALARNDEEEPIEEDDDWLRFDFDRPFWSDEDSEAWEQNQELLHLSRSAENSADAVTTHDEEEPRDNDGAWPAGPASPPLSEGDNSQVQDREQSQQYLLGDRQTESSAELRASDNEEEPRDNNDAWTARVISPPICEDDNAESQQNPLGSRAAENAAEVLANESEEEEQDIEIRPSSSLLCVICMSCYSQLLQVHKQQRRRATLKRHGQVDGSGNGTGANDVPAADSAPAEQGAAEEGTALSDSASSSAEQGVVIRCPICMDTYSEIVQSGRLMVATMCGHVFCSECLPVALETVGMCPTCREELTPDLYIPIYL